MEPLRLRQVVVLTGDHHYKSTIEHVEALATEFPSWQFTVVQEQPRRRWGQYLKQKRQQLRREGLAYVSHTLRRVLVALTTRKRRQPNGVPFAHSLEDLAERGVVYRRCESLHSDETIRYLRELNPWLGISIGAPILKPTVFKIPQLGTINLHKSALPEYRGTPPGFWELHDGAGETGASVHRIDEGLDTGPLITQRRVPIGRFTTPAGLASQLDLLGSKVLIDALHEIDRNPHTGESQPAPNTPVRRRPPLKLARSVQRKTHHLRASATRSSRMRRLLKVLVLGAYVYAWAPLRNLARRALGRCHTTVLVYHRVSDDFLDSVTVGVEQFQQHLRTLRSRYEVVDLPDFLRSRGQKQRRPRVVLTFDDGYENNLLAAILLRRERIPCTFFVSTRVVGTDGAFPHDLERLGYRVPSLSWEQIRRMASWGFHFGNHTADHANLGKVPLEEAVSQVKTATSDLVREMGTKNGAAWLAYPYGKPEDMSEQLRSKLPELGVQCCFSAYGGTNPPDFDTMNIRRQGIDHHFDRLSLQAAAEGWRFA